METRVRPSELDFELTEAQYNSEEYITGKHDGMWTVISIIQQQKGKGHSIDEILHHLFSVADQFDSQ